MEQNIIICGFMGAGKSLTAELLAKSINFPLIELDTLIEKTTGKTINNIFETMGEAAFREYEKEALQNALQNQGTIISLGGGTPCSIENFAAIQESHSLVIYLQTSLDICLERTKNSSRPMLQRGPSSLDRLYKKRLPSYESLATFTISTDFLTPDEIVNKIILFLKNNG